MSYGIDFDEDAYWERRREEFENPRRFRPRSAWDDDEPFYESDILSIDDDIEDIEAEYKCPIDCIDESDLLDIVKKFCGVLAESAKWVPRLDAIEYRYEVQY